LGGSGAEREAEGIQKHHNRLYFIYKTQKRFAFNTCSNSGDCLGENDAVFLIKLSVERDREGLLQNFQLSADLAVMMALNLKQIGI
jgi:hypothetical protein